MARVNIQIKEVKLNNKSRKGNYIYIKEPKKQGKYYKKTEGLSNSDYLEIYNEGGLRAKRGGVTKTKIEAVKRIKNKRVQEVDKIIKDGYAQATIERAERLTPYGMKTAYMDLLRNKDKVGDKLGVVRDKELLELITRPENVEKWKHRIMYNIELYGKEGLLATMNNQVPKTLGVIISEIRELGVIGGDIEGYGKMAKEVKNKNYNFEKIKDGKVTGFKIKMVFRKGR